MGRGKATKDEARSCLNYSQSPSLLIAMPVEIVCLPPMSVSIIDPREYCLRKLIPNKFKDHSPMGGCPKGLRRSEIFFRVLIINESLLNFNRNWNWDLIDRLLLAFFNIWQLIFGFISLRIFLRLLKSFWGLLNVRLGLGKLQRKLLIFFIRFFESSIQSGDLTILCFDKASQDINGSAHFGILAL